LLAGHSTAKKNSQQVSTYSQQVLEEVRRQVALSWCGGELSQFCVIISSSGEIACCRACQMQLTKRRNKKHSLTLSAAAAAAAGSGSGFRYNR
jgi:RIO-like serine/threonine protein kinase